MLNACSTARSDSRFADELPWLAKAGRSTGFRKLYAVEPTGQIDLSVSVGSSPSVSLANHLSSREQLFCHTFQATYHRFCYNNFT